MAIATVALCVVGFVGCSGCGALNPGTPDAPSPYVTTTGEAPDRVLYNADFGIAVAYDALHAFVKFEFDNRAAMAGTPAIKAAADKIRAGAPGWFKSAVAVRDAYASNPNAENRSALQQALDVLQTAIVEANRYRAVQPLTP